MHQINNKRSRWIFLWLAVALSMVGCNRKTLYSHYEPVRVSGWNKSEVLHFSVSPVADSAFYIETIGVRITTRYPFCGLALVVEQQRLPSGEFYADTLRAILLDSLGNIQGGGVSRYSYSFALKTLSLNKGDSLSVNIRHAMNEEKLEGVTDIGFTIESM